ncbi:GNAT family protein [Agrococcus sp. SL85]|nr:GNAT family protein [Agrococcus sp. SL85]
MAEPPDGLVRLAAEVDGGIVGYADLHDDGTAPDRRELGFLVGGPHQGRGIGTAVARAALDHGFGAMGLERIWAEAWGTNAASMRILARLMRRTGDGAAGTYLGEPARYAQFATDRTGWRRRGATSR